MNMLMKAQSVLKRDQTYKGPPLPSGTQLVMFHNMEDGAFLEDNIENARVLTFAESTWEHMGQPEEITITIEPGNTINNTHAADVAGERLA